MTHWTPPEPARIELTPETEAKVEGERAATSPIVIPETLDRPHKLVAMSRRLLQKQKPVGGVLRSLEERCLAVIVSPPSLDRSLRIMDALLRAFDERNLRYE